MFDNRDIQILKILQKDGRSTASDIAKEIDLSIPAVGERIKKLNEKTAYISIIVGLIGGFLLFPAPDFSKSLLVGIILPIDIFPAFIPQSLLFLSFLIATFIPAVIWKLR